MSNQEFSDRSPGYDVLSSLFDDGTFVELGAYIRRKESGKEYEGVVCGYGSVNMRLVFAFAQEGERLGGAIDENHAKKIESLYSAAIKCGAPVIGLFNSKGVTVKDGFSSVAACGRILKCISDASGVIPQIAVINGVCAGTMAAAAGMFDILIAVKDKSLMYVASPSAIGEGHGKADHLAGKGLAALVEKSTEDAMEKAGKLVCLLPDNCNSVARTQPDDDASRASSIGDDERVNIGELSDKDSFVELYSAYEPSMVTGFGTMSGITVGFVANSWAVNSGKITAGGALKASRFIKLCDSFGIPVVTLVNSAGAELSVKEEDSRLVSALSWLAMAYSSSTIPKVTLVCGKAYGAAAVLMGSRSMGADVVYAVKDSSVGVLSPEAAVAFMCNDSVGRNGSREELEKDWEDKNLSPVCAAEAGEIDDIIDDAEARARICSALYMLEASGVDRVRKHAVDPL